MKVKILYDGGEFEIPNFEAKFRNQIILTYFGGNPDWVYRIKENADQTSK